MEGICMLLWLITMMPFPRLWLHLIFVNKFVNAPACEDGSEGAYIAYLGMNEF